MIQTNPFPGVGASPYAAPIGATPAAVPAYPGAAPSPCAAGACGPLSQIPQTPWGAPDALAQQWGAAMRAWMSQSPGCCGSSCCGQICQACNSGGGCGGGCGAMPASFAANFPAQRQSCCNLLGCAACASQCPGGCSAKAFGDADHWLRRNGFDPDVATDPWGGAPPKLWKQICEMANGAQADPKAFWALLQQVVQAVAAGKR